MIRKRFSDEYKAKLSQSRTEANQKISNCQYCHCPVSALNLQRHENSCYKNPKRKGKSYTKICFSFHARECVVCGEFRCVEVHHLDSNRENNSPTNLIPLCPTHHRYWHSKHRWLIEKKVLDYQSFFLKTYKGR